MTAFEWKIFARNPTLGRDGEIKDYTEATLMPVYNGIGTWSLQMNRRAVQAANLVQPGWGIVATRNGSVVFSGPATHWQYTVTMDSDKVEISGVSDDIWLKWRNASPSPAETGPPYVTQASDVRTGPASTVLSAYVNVNAGPGAIATRQVTGLTIATDPVIGASVSGNARWDNLLTFLQPLAVSGGLGFRVVQVGIGLQFQTFTPTDRTASVKFSVGLRNLAGFEYGNTAPDANYIFIGATGTGTARVIKEYPDSASIAVWGRIEGELVDQRGTSNPTELAQAGADALTQNAEQASLSITPIETPSCMYGQHYFLGDKVTVQLEGPAETPYPETGQIQDILRSVTIHLTPGGPQTVTPAIGTPARGDISKLFRKFLALSRRVNNLERQ